MFGRAWLSTRATWITIALLALGTAGAEGGQAPMDDPGAPRAGGPRMLFPILERGRWGFIDSTGRVTIPPRYESTVAVAIERGSDALPPRRVRSDFAGVFMAPGVGPESTSTLGVASNDSWGLVDQRGAGVGRLRFERMRGFAEGLAPVRMGGLWGFVDATGTLAIPARFDDVGGFRAGLSVISMLGKRGVIDARGTFVLDPRFDLIFADDSVFHDNRVVVEMDSLMGYANRAGRVAIPPAYDHAYRFSEGLAAVVKDGRIGYVDTTGRMVIAPRFDSAEPFEGGLARIMVGELYGFIDRTGAYVASPKYNDASDFRGRDFATVRRGQESGTLDRSGNWRPSSFDELLVLDDSLALGRVRGRTGLVRRATGALIKPFPWEQIGEFSQGLAAVRNPPGRFGFIDVTGSLVIPPRFDEVDQFRHGLCKVAAGDTLGYVRRTGEWAWFGRFSGYRSR